MLEALGPGAGAAVDCGPASLRGRPRFFGMWASCDMEDSVSADAADEAAAGVILEGRPRFLG